MEDPGPSRQGYRPTAALHMGCWGTLLTTLLAGYIGTAQTEGSGRETWAMIASTVLFCAGALIADVWTGSTRKATEDLQRSLGGCLPFVVLAGATGAAITLLVPPAGFALSRLALVMGTLLLTVGTVSAIAALLGIREAHRP